MNGFFTTPVIWFVIGLLLILTEFMLPGVIIIFFGIGAWVTAVLVWLLGLGINGQLLIFIVSSLILLLSLRRWLKHVFYGQIESSQKPGENLEDLIGEEAIVNKPFKSGTGKVKFRGTDWKAKSEYELEKGQPVRIINKKSITLIVEPINEEE